MAARPTDAVSVKTTERALYDEARAAAHGCDDALLHTPEGAVLECTIANVFFVLDGRLVTPPASLPLLPGIARARVLEAADAAGIRAAEVPISLADAATAEACFVTNALLIAHPVQEIEGVGRFDSVAWTRRLRRGVRSKGV